MSETFRCLLVTKSSDGAVKAEVTTRPLSELPAGEVLIQVHYSSLNYKDGLSSQGHPGVTRKFPHVPGVDAAGEVVESASSAWRAGDKVIVTGWDMGQNTWGGFGEFIRVPAGWPVRLPTGLTLRESMIYGTAGLTAAQCVDALIARGVKPDSGEIVVTGSTGGVGSVAVALLAKLGYQAVAVTGKPAGHDFLKRLGAARIIDRDEVNDPSGKLLLSERWAGAVDTIGGNTLGTIIRSARRLGVVTACGLVGGHDLPLTVYPFILRGVDLVGIDSAECPVATRERLWNHLAGDWRPASLDSIATDEVTLDELPSRIAKILKGEMLGRAVLRHAVADH